MCSSTKLQKNQVVYSFPGKVYFVRIKFTFCGEKVSLPISVQDIKKTAEILWFQKKDVSLQKI